MFDEQFLSPFDEAVCQSISSATAITIRIFQWRLFQCTNSGHHHTQSLKSAANIDELGPNLPVQWKNHSNWEGASKLLKEVEKQRIG